MNKMSVEKKSDVPLEEALTIAGGGPYTYFVVLTSGLVLFSSLLCLNGMAFVMPMAGCELHLSDTERGLLSSMTFTGMLFIWLLIGFLADTVGRKGVMQHCLLGLLIVNVLWTIAPDISTLGVILFINGLFLTGTLTTVYVYISEFCSPNFRSMAILSITAIAAMANIYLPGMAWIILPLDIQIPLFGQLVFTSWRLYVLLLSIPVLLAWLLLLMLPETPKFLLNQGKQKETLAILKSMYAVNQRKSKKEFPVSSLILDSEDQITSEDRGDGNRFIGYLKKMMKQIVELFSRQYILFILLLSAVFFGQNGICNSVVLWFPDQTSRVRHYSQSHQVFNVTLCDVMSEVDATATGNCKLDYDFLSVGILLGVVEVFACIIVGVCVNRMNKKLVLAGFTFLAAGFFFLAVLVTSEYIIIISLAIVIIILYVTTSLIISVIVDVFPTQLRSSATSITFTCARLGAAVGGPAMGVLFKKHCITGYYGMISVLVATGILCIMIPKKKTSS